MMGFCTKQKGALSRRGTRLAPRKGRDQADVKSTWPNRQRQDASAEHHRHRALDLPAALHVLVLHLAGRRDAKRRARSGAGRRVDDRDGIAGTLGHGLVQLHAVLVASRRRVESGRGSREEELRSRLNLLLKRGALRRARGEGATVGSGRRVDGLKLDGESVVVQVYGDGMESKHTSSSVKRWKGQKSSSSSNSKLLAASMRCRYSEYAGGSGTISLTLR